MRKQLVIKSDYSAFWKPSHNRVLARCNPVDKQAVRMLTLSLVNYTNGEYPFAYMTYTEPESNA